MGTMVWVITGILFKVALNANKTDHHVIHYNWYIVESGIKHQYNWHIV